jgi:hypothetical protein
MQHLKMLDDKQQRKTMGRNVKRGLRENAVPAFPTATIDKTQIPFKRHSKCSPFPFPFQSTLPRLPQKRQILQKSVAYWLHFMLKCGKRLLLKLRTSALTESLKEAL